jgi:hypothetical protein
VVLALATTMTWQIVSAADEQVSDRPLAPLNAAAPALGSSTTTDPTAGSFPAPPTTSDFAPSTTGTSVGGTGATSPTTSPSTSPSTAGDPWKTQLVQTSGGVVVLEYRPGEVTYQSATPAPGFQVHVETKGPPAVELEFESESDKVEIRAEWRDGELDVELSGSDDH